MKKILLFSYLTLIIQFLNAQQPDLQWLSKYNGKGDFSDKFNAIKVDGSGNIYLAGYTVNTGNKKDFLTVKMNSIGDTLWTNTMDGTGNSDDEALDIAIDGSGNSYVTGYSKGNGTKDDYLTIKYNSNGILQWSTTYNSISNQNEQANSIGVDGAGNVYVTGQSDSDASAAVENDDYATVKYSSTGVQLWVVRYNGTGNGTDRATKMMVTSVGDIYITGRSDNGTDDDYVTIKYATSGTQTWLSTFDSGDKDKAESITLDSSGDIVVTGRSNNGIDDDFLTIKYLGSTGVDLWAGGVLFNGGSGDDEPTAITTDENGNVFVTGRSDTDNSIAINYDFVTIKYDPSGFVLWENTYNGTGNGNDTPNGITVDSDGKVIVCGQTDSDVSSIITNNNSIVISYLPTGIQSWFMTYNGTSNLSDGANAIAVDGTGNIFIGGNSDNTGTQKDGLIIKYITSGEQSWARNYNGKGDNSDNINAIAVDASGNSYLTGYTYNASSEKDIIVLKLNSDGDTLWTKKYNGSDNGADEGMDIAIDASGNIYVTGYVKENVTGHNFATFKYNSSGTLLWNYQYNNNLVNGTDKASNISVDAAGNVYVTGYSFATLAGNEDYLTIKYNSSGIQQWATRYNGTGNSTDIPVGIKTDAIGNIYITGKSFNGLDDAFATVKYNSSGAQQWVSIYSSGNGNDRPAALAIDAVANVFITGRTNNGSDDDFATIKYNSAGTQQWITFYNGTNGDDRAIGIALDVSGNSYVTGKSSNEITDNFATVKYNSTGVQQWVSIHDGTANRNDTPTGIKVDGLGFIIVAGEVDNGTISVPNTDYALIKYDATGVKIWDITYDGNDHGTDGINAFAIDNSNSIYVTGNSTSLSEQKNILTIKYGTPAGLDENEKSNDHSFVYPNPFSHSAIISISKEINLNDLNNTVSFKLFDVLGNEVKSSDNIQESEFKINRGNLLNGIYIYQLIQGEKVISTGKLTIQ